MLHFLTQGVIDDILSGGRPERPVLQVLALKSIPQQNAGQERYRLIVSDGKYQCSCAMLATQLNAKVHSGEISDNCILELGRYICNTVQETKKIIVIVDASVVKSGSDVGRKLGNPVVHSGTQLKQDQSSAPPTQPNFAPSVTQRNFATNKPPAANNPATHPICSLTPYQNKWTVCGRVINKSDLRTWSNSRGEGKLFSFILMDESGEIKVTGFNEQADKFYDLVEADKLYYVSQGTLKTADKRYNFTQNDYEMTLNNNSQITLCHDKKNIPCINFQFVPIEKIESVEKDSIIDIIGICKDASNLTSIVQRSSGKELRKRDISIVDESRKEIQLTLWGQTAEDFDAVTNPVVAVKGAKVSDFGGKSLSLVFSSVMQLNPDILEAHRLKGWFDNGGNLTDTVSLSSQRGGSVGVGSELKTLAEAKMENLGNREQADYYSAKCHVVLIRKENFIYPSCPVDGCNKKVVDMNNGLYRCEKCNKEHDRFKHRLLLSANIADATDHCWVTMFQDQAEVLLGRSGDEIGAMKENNPDALSNVFQEATFKEFIFRLRVKMETYNDDNRLKTTVAALTPLDYKEYSRKLISEIEALM